MCRIPAFAPLAAAARSRPKAPALLKSLLRGLAAVTKADIEQDELTFNMTDFDGESTLTRRCDARLK